MATKKHTQNSLRLLKVKSNPDGTAERKRIAIGGGLLLEVSSNGAKTWRLRYRLDDKPKMLWVGTFGSENDQDRNIYTLAGAVAKAEELKNQIKKGIDPKREQEKIKEQAKQERQNTFETIGIEWLEVWKKERNGKAESTIQRTERLLFDWLCTGVGSYPITDLSAPIVGRALLARAESLNAQNNESLSYYPTIEKAVGVAKAVFEHALICEYIEPHQNPSPYLLKFIERQPKKTLTAYKEKSHPAITKPDEFSVFLKVLWHDATTRRSAVVSAALRLSCYLFVRQGELRFMRWDELDVEARQIAIPENKEGKKTDSAFIVPLADQALEIIQSLRPLTGHTPYIFTCQKNTPLSENTISKIFRIDLGYRDRQDPHGLRASARTMLDERLGYPPQVIEVQLDHAPKETHGKAYNRTKYLSQRREMMQAWADYVDHLVAN